jgi:hypothetical protein
VFASPSSSEWNISDAPKKVFRCHGLNAGSIRKLPPQRLVESLTRAFEFYNGKDSLGVVLTGPRKPTLEFSGIQLPISGIARFKRRSYRWDLSRARQKSSRETAKLNAAHLIVSFWRMHGPGFLRRGRVFERQSPRYCRNCCLLTGVENSRDLPY